MPVGPGTRLGPYEVTALIGEGGMGKVWRAHHTALRRDDALKVLPDAFASDPDRLARFRREAQVLASLNHPNIAHVYGLEQADGVQALVMELVEGPTLADRIAQGPILVDEALPIAKQIAEALEAAHEQGIIHRDLKPANIKLRPDGTVKVLDFGLAKALEPASGGVRVDATASPTMTSPALMTGIGMLLGTGAYMSPEQARGKPVDKRSDIWSFGCVLYEMLTGRRAFEGEDVADTVAAIVRGQPDWNALAGLPATVRAVLRSCLQKDLQRRLRHIGDARVYLEELSTSEVGPDLGRHVAGRTPLWRRAVPAVAGAFLIAALGGYIGWMLRTVPARQAARFIIPIPSGTGLEITRHVVAISPRGTHIAYTANGRVYVRALDQLEAVPIQTSGGPASSSPFFSPDGQWIGFYQGGQVKRVSVSGGAPIVVCAAGNPFGFSWTEGDVIVFGQGPNGIMRVPAGGGTPEVLVKVDEGESAHGPQLLPGGRAILFTLRPHGAGTWNEAKIVVQSLDSGERKVVIQGGRDARYLPTGHLLYALRGTLLAVPFDINSLAVTGMPVPLVENVALAVAEQTGAAHYSVSGNGTLVYILDQGNASEARRLLTWVDRQGREEPLKVPPRAYRYPQLSPDGQRVAVDIQDEQVDIWIWHVTGETLTRLTLEPSQESYPVWTADGRRVIFGSDRSGPVNLFWQPADGTGTVEQLTDSQNNHVPMSVSPDRAAVVVREQAPGGGDFGLLLLGLGGERRPRSLVQTPFHDLNGVVSPDGRWLAYQSTESGRGEIYVRPFPNVDEGRWQVSTEGGTRPLWARSGQELFYLTLDGDALMSVPISGALAFKAGTPQKLLDTRTYYTPAAMLGIGITPGRTYDVSLDGRRFLMIKPQNQNDERASPLSFTVVQDWTEDLKRLVPTN